MNTETRDWFKRLPFWLPLVMRELPESGEVYMGDVMVPCVLGVAIPLFVLLGPCIFWEVLEPRYFAVSAMVSITLYLIIGVLAFFCYVGKSYGPWQSRGPW